MADASVTIIGGGVVGLAIAAELAPYYSPLFLLERNSRYGQETSSRNSEVIHAGLYYPEGSLKARLCIEGKTLLYELCARHGIAHKRLTKIITAVEDDELGHLDTLLRNGRKNGVELEMLSASDVHDLEPHIASVGGILSPSSGIISAHDLMDYFHHVAMAHGAVIQERCNVVSLRKDGLEFEIGIQEGPQQSSIRSEWVINAAGLESDRIAESVGIDIDAAGYRLHYCKGSYFSVHGPLRKSIARLVYPIPPKESLGVHALVDLAGRLRFGPDAEYVQGRRIDYSVDESKRSTFAASVQRILPGVREEDLVPDISGIRPKLQAKGAPARDFIISHETRLGFPGLINLIGIDSPGLTSAPAIAQYVMTLMKQA